MREVATKEAVWAAAAALDAAGTLPTVLLIRDQIGGSFTTIQKHLRAWQEAQVEAQAIAVPAEIDDQVNALAMQLARDLWRSAIQHSAAEIAQSRQQARAEVAQAEAERDGAYEVISRLEAEAEAEQVRTIAIITRLEQEAEARIAQITEAQDEVHTLREALATTRAQVQAEALRAGELERQLTSAQAELAQVRAQGTAQLNATVTAIQQQLTEQAAQLQRLSRGGTTGASEEHASSRPHSHKT